MLNYEAALRYQKVTPVSGFLFAPFAHVPWAFSGIGLQDRAKE